MATPLQITVYPPGDPRNTLELAQAPVVRPDPVGRPSIELPRRRRQPSGPNPFARFAEPEAPPQQAAPMVAPQVEAPAPVNPFSQFAMPEQPEPEAAPAAPEPAADATPVINWNAPAADVRAAIRLLPEKQRNAAMKEWAKNRVAGERKRDAGNLQTFYDVGRNLIRGTPIGSFLDEGMAAYSAATGGPNGPDYDEAVALERARNEAADAEATKLGTLPVIGDVTTAGLTKLAGGILSAPLAPVARVFQGAAMLPRMGNAALSGMGYGALYGSGEGENVTDRATNAAIGGTVGSVLGGATVPVAQGIGNTVRAVRNAGRLPPEIAQQGRGAVSRVAQAVQDDNLLTRYAQTARELGPEGMIADMGDNLRQQVDAIAQTPGPGQSMVANALRGRREGAVSRISAAMDDAFGPVQNVPQQIEHVRRQASARAGPLYDQFYNSRFTITQELADIIEAAQSTGAVNRARDLMIADRVDRRNVPLPQLLDYIKRGIDDMARAAEPGSNAARIYGNLARSLRNEVDNILRAQSPNNTSSWARARLESGDGFQFEEAAEMGQNVFRKSITPDQMAADMAGMGPGQRYAYQVGARDAGRTVMGNASTAFGPSGDTAIRRTLQSDFGREKVRQIARTPQSADELARRVNAETQFARTYDAALSGSQTARREAGKQAFPNPAASNQTATEMGRKSLSGLAIEGAYRLGNMVLSGALNDRRLRIAENAAEMLIAQGARRDQVVRGLQQYIERRRLTGAQAEAVTAFIDRIARGSRQVIIDQTTLD